MAWDWSSRLPAATADVTRSTARAVALLRGIGRVLQRVRRPFALAMALTWMGLIWMLSSIEQGPGNGLLG